MKSKQYKNKYRQEICNMLGKIKTESELKTVLELVYIYANLDYGDLSRANIEKALIVSDLFECPNLSTNDLSLIDALIRTFSGTATKQEGVPA